MVSADEVEAIAKLARLALSDDERAALPAELTAVLGHMAALAAVPTAGIAPMIFGTAPEASEAAITEAHRTHTMADGAGPTADVLPAHVATAGAAHVRAMQFVVPSVLPEPT